MYKKYLILGILALFVFSGCDTPQTSPVQPVGVTGLTLNTTAAMIMKTGTLSITATVLPSDASNKNVSWTSSDQTIATVNETGLVTAISYGKATITAKSQDGEKSASANIQVSAADLSATGNLTGFESLGAISPDTAGKSWGAGFCFVGAASNGTNLEIAIQMGPQDKNNHLYVLVDVEELTSGTTDPSFMIGWGSTGVVNTIANVDFAFAGYRNNEVLNAAGRGMTINGTTVVESTTSVFRSQHTNLPNQSTGTATYKFAIPYATIGSGASSGQKVHIYTLFGAGANVAHPTWGGIHSMFPVQSVLENPQVTMDTASTAHTLN